MKDLTSVYSAAVGVPREEMITLIVLIGTCLFFALVWVEHKCRK